MDIEHRPHDPNHPYVRKLIGCGHGRLFSEPCPDCEIVRLNDEYKRAIKTIQRVRDRLRELGAVLPVEVQCGVEIDQFISSEIKEIDELLAATPEDNLIERMSLEVRRAKIKEDKG